MDSGAHDELPQGFRFTVDDFRKSQGTARADRPDNYDKVVRFVPEAQLFGFNDGTVFYCGLVRHEPGSGMRGRPSLDDLIKDDDE